MTDHLTRAVLALDPGGTKCDAVLTLDDGTPVSWGRVQMPATSGRDSRILDIAIRQAIGTHTFDELHVATFTNSLPKGIIRPGRTVRVRVWPLSEGAGALALAGQRTGVVALAGTGTRVSALTRDGRELSLDGMGPMLGDRGGAYSIGLRAVQAAARAHMHPRHATSMMMPALRHFIEAMPDDAKRHMNAFGSDLDMQGVAGDNARLLEYAIQWSLKPQDRSLVASLSRIVDEEANKGDKIAIHILREAAADIAETLWDLVDHLQIANEDYIIAGTGSVIRNSDIFWNHFCELTRQMAPRFTPVRCSGLGVLGNAAYVLREIRPEISIDEIIGRLLASTPPPVRM